MNTEAGKIENFVKNHLDEAEGLFLIEVKIAPGNKVTILLDGDNGVTIDNCSSLNKSLYKFIEDTQLFGEQNFSLEVSSFGVGNPLKTARQYRKNIGRKVEVVLNDGQKIEGTLKEVKEAEIVLEQKTGKGAKAITKTVNLFFNQIKQTIVLITF